MVGKKAFKPTAADTRMCTQCRVIGRAVAVAEELLNEAGAPETFGFAASSSTGLAAARQEGQAIQTGPSDFCLALSLVCR